MFCPGQGSVITSEPFKIPVDQATDCTLGEGLRLSHRNLERRARIRFGPVTGAPELGRSALIRAVAALARGHASW